MKLLIIGYRGSGKTLIGEMLQNRSGWVPKDSSQFLLHQVLFPALKDKYGYSTPSACYEDRNNHRQEWFELIKAFNDPPDRLTREILEEGDVYVGMRSRDEFESARRHFDAVVWVDAEGRVTPEPITSMELTPKDADYILANRDQLIDLPRQVDQLAEWLETEDEKDIHRASDR